MLQEYRPATLVEDQRSPGPSEYLRGKVSEEQEVPHSPKVRTKLRFWNSVSAPKHTMDDSVVSVASSSVALELEEIARRRAFAHFDCQSLTTNLSYSVRQRRNLLAKRRNTTTGASAASMLFRSSTPDGDASDDDYGDGKTNELVESCPFFRNEIGGEEERVVSLSRLQNNGQNGRKPLHRPPLAYGVAVLEFPPGETHWRNSTCPYQKFPRPIENVDQGAKYYRHYFYNKDHQNWFGMDEQLGPVAISIRREKVLPESEGNSSITQYQYRLVIRTSELQTLRGAVLEDAIPNIKASSNPKTLHTKEVLEYVAPEIQLSSLRLGQNTAATIEQILKLDEQGLTNNYKVGIMYCKAGQSSEEEMYNNEEAGPAFLEFLDTIGKTVKLNGFNKYKAGLDNKSDSTGLYSVYAEHQDCEIMFHVSTMLPFTAQNRQQLLRKRHIGNDIVTIVFQEPGALPFTPKGIRSQFQHVFIVVNAINPCTENTYYKIAVSRSKEVEVFGPPIKEGAVFPKGKVFTDFLLAKVVNAENAAHRSEKFVTMATRTRQEYLKDLVKQNANGPPVDTGQKFSIFSSSKKKDKIRPRFIPDLCQRGAILWQVMLDDSSQREQIECFLGISSDTFVLIEEHSKQIVFVTPCKSILGWSPQTNSLRIYHHQGECMTIHMRDANADRDELMEVMDRLKAVTKGVLAQEFTISRNIMGQLGFHVQPDGIVTLVESQGQAWQAGLRQNSRLVEICKVAVATLTYDQMVDLLKTSLNVLLTVIPPLADGTARKGCTLQNCKYNEGNFEGDYENLGIDENKGKRAPQMQQAVAGNHRRIYDRSFSPPRSSNSSGYGTGSSSKSFHGQETKYATNVEGTLTSSLSGLSNDDKWYDILQELDPPPKSGHQMQNSRTNTFPSTPKRNNNQHQISQHSVAQNHNHYTVQSLHHNKVQASNSLPLQQFGNYSQPLSFHNEELVYKNNIVKQQTERLRQECEYHRSNKELNSDFQRLNVQDSRSTSSSISDRINLIGSEDDLSAGSGNCSPKTRRNKHINANYSSRNQSPRSLNGEAKLRPGVTSRSSNRNSANISNAFQEELLRLIDPDNIEPQQQQEVKKETKTHSRENLNNALSVHKGNPEVILTMARPATVISNASTTSSPLQNEFKNDVLKGKVQLAFAEEFPLPQEGDWPSLVDTATRAMMTVSNDAERWEDEGRVDASLASSSSAGIPELQSHVAELETKVSHEQRRRISLENEVRRLNEENAKLRDQAQAAVHQLRKFTEWFFKNVKRQ
ncbi:unnamed protein product [Brassicogethes aeneus]|uniref:Signal-induced proliferation-associated 1-like protein 2 n=1 Tax=Brassicogethes aeneus TaxID=1431903 RepID=A0A9P0BAU6_BRAAE|nr:unnamed protein product [Brassicogethes aeneus]